ncbi:hypothetical protein F4556_006838 [Kitasatospora gansuensis]|uniref:Uncharacterized protein n=1 Tax=Kitasatospora gansuensis TaxID=258050 RepID=A0A7W7SIW4_9ACTN|nr:hypothetical protein [Kitasatospora gansuensis]MBB4951303.1 hypothetical protein [Kitasatospora gansuensis]
MFGNWRVQRGVLLICAALGLTVALCLWFARGLQDFGESLALNLAPELLTTVTTLLVIQPVVARLEEDRVREHLRLDYVSFCDKVAQTGDIVCILDTTSTMISGDTAQRFADAAGAAIGRGAILQIMLLDPDSLAAQQRSHELSADVRHEILRTIRDLRRIETRLAPERRAQLQVRVYDAAPSIQLYRCGQRMMVSFFPVDRRSGDAQQLEVRATTPLGSFVSERFAELWNSGRPINDLLKKQVELLDDSDAAGEPIWLEYVQSNGDIYVSDHRLLVELARRGGRPVRALLDGSATPVFHLTLVEDSEAPLYRALASAHADKYGADADVFMCFRPAPAAPD